MEYDATSQKFSLSPEQALCLADPNGPADVPGAYSIVRDLFHIRDRALDDFRTGSGLVGIDHHECSIEILQGPSEQVGRSRLQGIVPH